jgi:tetratricopeptide (TPR) repeat protein
MVRPLALVAAVVAAAALTTGCKSKGPSKDEYVARGDQFFQQRKYPEAIIEYRNAIRVDPNFGKAHEKLALAYVETKEVRGLVHEAIVAADLLDSVEAHVNASELLLRIGQFEDAKTRAEKALAKDPRNMPALLLKANATAGLKQYDVAIREIDDAIKVDPSDGRTYATLGIIAANKGRLQEAEAAYRKAVEIQPDSIAALLSLGNFYLATARFAEAEPLIKKSVSIDPKNVGAHRALATLYASSGRIKEAEAPLKAVTTLVNDSAARLALADYYIASQRIDDAKRLLNSLAKEKDGFGPANTRLAAIEASERKLPDAHRRLDNLLGRDPKQVDALVLKARLLLRERRIDEALDRARAAVDADPNSTLAQNLLGTIQFERGDLDSGLATLMEAIKLSPRSITPRIQIAGIHLTKGNVPAALQLAEEIVREVPKHAGARTLLAQTLIASGDLSRAEGYLRDLVKESPNAPLVHLQLGRLAGARKDVAGARREFARALELNPADINALMGQVSADIAEKNGPRARAAIEARLKRTPDDPAALLVAADVYRLTGDNRQMEAALRKTIEIQPSNMSAYSKLAALYFHENKLDEALKEYEALSKRQPKSLAAPTMIGLILEAQNKPAEAQKAYERVIAASPTAPVAANNLAWIYANSSENLDMALQLAQTAKQMMQDRPEVNDTLGWVYIKKNMAALAISPLESSVQRDPKNPVYRYHLGIAYAKTGDRVRAKASFDEALKQRPGYADAEAARRAL